MTVILSDKDVRSVGDTPTVIGALERGLRAEAAGPGAVLPERLNLGLDLRMFRIMPAMLPAAGVLGLKCFFGTLSEGVRYVVMVADLSSGEVLGIVDAAYLTALRTGAVSGIATRYLARPESRTVGLIGSGLEAETNLAAVCAVLPIDMVRVYSRNEQRCREFATRMCARLGVEIAPVADPRGAVGAADVVVVATNTGRDGDVAYRGEWLSDGQHVVSIGSTAPFLRELDPVSFLRPDVVVFDADPGQVGRESGDVMALLADNPRWSPTGVLSDVLTGNLTRTSPEQITLFKSVGTAAQDLLSARAVQQIAAERGIGIVVPDIAEPKAF
ncbi:ornithine cyclodeaminase family protein [Mycobacterium intracellulare]|uniref:ornithine cyclodeaminase family protein n=1 Tax=Mycobacterium intracellulare TaxID=1767 RepID=UPI00044BD3E1|nr:ornithine cyclodeaminase family protein [Mycobacterium intracellulare]ETZ39908.1 ornithine cyclodeaminase/mu-crystallin family protein [Mycobacterium intracellulare MIN_061107_1834]MCA2273521.1 ornithine cyclodeaminase family protein [Mycobacterium intracellulare]MCA2326039.1 ornithine cyclodeaminase family protein [Mycobacterium intracellulare]UEB24812.1 ornithine cyclodeaminase family protein [Mycobacterium intracellulare]BCO60178.1 ornithine cyclodeaminase [Mycobacterium intracellulare]